MTDYENMVEQVAYFRDQLMEQVRKNKQLESEADWLAKECVSWMDAYFGEVATGDYDDEPSMQPEYWREEARKAVEDAVSNTD